MSTEAPPMKEVDFSVIKEDWSRYLVNDGTILKVRVVVRKILRSVEVSPLGYPNFGIESMNAVTAIVSDTLRRPPSREPLNPKVDQAEEIEFIPQEEKWQEYHTIDGFKVFVKPVVTKVFRYNKYNAFGEPIYNVNVQAIVNAGKIGSPT